jgi:putative acetyltransferase
VLHSHRSDHGLKDGRTATVRFKTPADLAAWRRFVALVPDGAGHATGTQLDLADLSTDYHRYDEHYLVAEVDREIVGALFVVPPEASLGYHREHVVEFHMDVLPGWRRMGVGSALLEALTSWARARGDVRRLEAAVLGWNTPVISLLERHGFEEEGRARGGWMVRTEAGSVEYDDVVHYGVWLDE